MKFSKIKNYIKYHSKVNYCFWGVKKILKEKVKPYTIITLVSIILVTAMSIGVFVVMTGWVQKTNSSYSETAEVLNTFGTMVEADIQIILEEDAGKYDTAYSYLSDIFMLNKLYFEMVEYNQTHPFNYTQQDFDEVKIEFKLNILTMIEIVRSTKVFDYSWLVIGAEASNNYSYLGMDYYFIMNRWYSWPSDLPIHNDLRNYTESYFQDQFLPVQLPEIKFDTWTYHLYNNISMLGSFGLSKSIDYISINNEAIGLSLVNLSLSQIYNYRDGYLAYVEKTTQTIQEFNNVLITLALSGVLLSFATSFDEVNFRRISLIVGILVLILAVFYFGSAFATFLSFKSYVSQIIVPNSFAFP